MACKTETTTIGEHEYSVTQWSVDISFVNKLKLGKLFGKSITKLTAIISDTIGEDSEDVSEEKVIEAIGEAIECLFEKAEPEEIFAFIKKCVVGTSCDGKRITEASFTELYSGDNLFEVYRLFFFILRVNYANLFPGHLIEGALTAIRKKMVD